MVEAVGGMIIEGVKWITGLIIDTYKGSHGITEEELKKKIREAIKARADDSDWLKKAIDDADSRYEAP